MTAHKNPTLRSPKPVKRLNPPTRAQVQALVDSAASKMGASRFGVIADAKGGAFAWFEIRKACTYPHWTARILRAASGTIVLDKPAHHEQWGE